jgi:hypothetical protein
MKAIKFILFIALSVIVLMYGIKVFFYCFLQLFLLAELLTN